MRGFLPTASVALLLGLSAETLRSWRRRGVGPAYVCVAGAVLRDRDGWRNWEEKAHGTVLYREEELRAFIERQTVAGGRLPRPFAGRLPRQRREDSDASREGRTDLQGEMKLCDPATAALLLDVTPEILRAWRRRGIGPCHIRLPGGSVRRGRWEARRYGRIMYEMSFLMAFADRLRARSGAQPR
jgi:hypothetical protein